MTTHRTAAMGCPVCTRVMDAHTSIDVDAPAPKSGDLTVCAYCVTMLRYVERRGAFSLAMLSLAEFNALDEETRSALRRAVNALDRLAVQEGRSIYVVRDRSRFP